MAWHGMQTNQAAAVITTTTSKPKGGSSSKTSPHSERASPRDRAAIRGTVLKPHHIYHYLQVIEAVITDPHRIASRAWLCFVSPPACPYLSRPRRHYSGRIFSRYCVSLCVREGGGGEGDMAGGGEEQGRRLFGVSLTDRPVWQQFLICSSGFFFGYLVNGICEEYVYNRLQFSYGWYFTFVQGFVYLGLIRLQGFTMKQMVNPWRTYVRLSAVLMGSNGLTKGSLAFLNYPAQIMFKSTKVLPVMIMGAFIPGLRRKYPFHEYVSAVMLVIGLILFTLADAQTSPNFSMIGVTMVSAALVMDAFLGNLQEAIFKMNPDTTQMEMLFCSTVVGLPFLAVPMVLTGELTTAWNACSQHLYVYAVLVFEAMATFVGQVSVLSLIALFGAATTAMVTTARKAVTLLLSYLIFTKPMTEQHVTGLLLITMGIMLRLLPEDKGPAERRRAKTTAEDKRRADGGEEEKSALV